MRLRKAGPPPDRAPREGRRPDSRPSASSLRQPADSLAPSAAPCPAPCRHPPARPSRCCQGSACGAPARDRSRPHPAPWPRSLGLPPSRPTFLLSPPSPLLSPRARPSRPRRHSAPRAAGAPCALRRSLLPQPRPASRAPIPSPLRAPAAAWSCQNGDPAARVALSLPPRRLRADEAQKPPQGALAEPDPSGRELLQQRQAAGLQRQRLASEERQAGTRKRGSLPGAAALHLPHAHPSPPAGRGDPAGGPAWGWGVRAPRPPGASRALSCRERQGCGRGMGGGRFFLALPGPAHLDLPGLPLRGSFAPRPRGALRGEQTAIARLGGTGVAQ